MCGHLLRFGHSRLGKDSQHNIAATTFFFNGMQNFAMDSRRTPAQLLVNAQTFSSLLAPRLCKKLSRTRCSSGRAKGARISNRRGTLSVSETGVFMRMRKRKPGPCSPQWGHV